MLASSGSISLDTSTDGAPRTLYVTKRDGRLEEVSFDKITERLKTVCDLHKIKCNYLEVAHRVISGLVNGIHTSKLDELACKIAHGMEVKNTQFDRLATVLEVSNLHKMTRNLGFYRANKLMNDRGMLLPEYWESVKKHGKYLEMNIIKYERDYDYDYAALQALKDTILTRNEDGVIERPQDVLMRQALTFYGDNLCLVERCYEMLSLRYCIHGTPTQMNAGITNQFSSCFLFDLDPSSVTSVYETLSECAIICANGGGTGGNCSRIPAEGTIVDGEESKGVMAFLKMFDQSIKNASTQRRKSSSAVYLDMTHPDVEQFMGARMNDRSEELKVRHIFLALMIPDLFMKRFEEGGMWSMFCPYKTPGLVESWGEKYEELYLKYEAEGKAVKQVPSRKLFESYVSFLLATGGPYCGFKDAINRYSNQQHLGTTMSMNLCAEISEVATNKSTAVCNLASVSLPACIVDGKFDHQRLYDIVEQLTLNLNRVIDIGQLPTERCIRSNNQTRAIGIGISGLADLFLELELPFDSDEARKLNMEIAETMYYAYARTSCNLAKESGSSYPAFEGSLTSKGIINPDLYDYKPSNRWDYDTLREDIKKYGMKNSLGIAAMPTSTGSQLLGNNESFEPFPGFIINRRVKAGEFVMVNKRAEKLLRKYKCWSPAKAWMLEHKGSVKGCPDVPEKVREILKTVWEIKPGKLIDLTADRNIFVDQSQSFTQHYSDDLPIGGPNTSRYEKVMAMIYKAWKSKLKTGVYYLRVQAPSVSAPLILDAGIKEEPKEEKPLPVCGSGGCTV